MKGHQQLLALRKRGAVPDWVFIDLDSDPLNEWSDWERTNNAKAALLVEASDKRLDMRFVVKLACFVQGENKDRVMAVRDACIAAGASRVIATVTQRFGSGEYATFRTSLVTDTAGHMAYDEAENLEAIDG